jgi:hypothetical protein
MTRRRPRSIEVETTATVYLADFDDEDIEDEAKERGLLGSLPDHDALVEVHTLLMRGANAEALVLLDRLLFPKWESPAAAKKQLTQHKEGARP